MEKHAVKRNMKENEQQFCAHKQQNCKKNSNDHKMPLGIYSIRISLTNSTQIYMALSLYSWNTPIIIPWNKLTWATTGILYKGIKSLPYKVFIAYLS